MKYLLVFLFAVAFFLTAKSCVQKNIELNRLNREIIQLQEDRPIIWIRSCTLAVNQSCYYGDCAVTPIEIMQEKICRLPEEL